jgi:hypothetical protein
VCIGLTAAAELEESAWQPQERADARSPRDVNRRTLDADDSDASA